MTELEVTRTDEFRRIAAIPWRDPAELYAPHVAEIVTRKLRSAGADGSRSFFPIQAAALVSCARSIELGSPGGFLPIGVGEGKTDVFFCLPTVLAASRPMLIVPGSLTTSKPGGMGKTERDFAKLRAHWVETPIRVITSFERLGRANGIKILEGYDPDLLLIDECHVLRNRETAACARVVEAFIRARNERGKPPRVRVIMGSGTITDGSLESYQHLADMCLGERSFLPNDPYDLDMWRRAVDAEIETGARVLPGVLLEFCKDEDRKGTALARARRAVCRRMHETEGVIASTTKGVKASLRFELGGTVPDGVPDDTWRDLRKWLLPNGEECLDTFEVHRQARAFAVGYWGEWDPAPPKPWYQARKKWAKIVRDAIAAGVCNTEVEARTLIGGPEWEAWDAIRRTFKPNPVARWLSTATLEACAQWAKDVKRGIIWVRHIPFGERLQSDFGLPYFREHGLDSRGVYIENASEPVIVASVQANGTGKNLQEKWNTNLLASPFGSPLLNEQTIGRTHRNGQPKDTVHFAFMVACAEHVNSLRKARERAAAIELLSKNPQKLVYGDWLFDPRDCVVPTEARWKTKQNTDDEDDDTELDDLLASEEE